MPRSSRCAAGVEPTSRRSGRARRAGPGVSRPQHFDLRAEELLLPRPAKGLSDLAVRAAARHRRRARLARAGRTPPRRHHAGASGRRRGQVAPRGLRRFRSKDRRRFQSQRRSTHRDRDRARSAVGCRRRRFLLAAAEPARVARRQRRQHGRGESALRRQHLPAACRIDGARYQSGGQEPELVSIPPASARARDRAPA